MEVPEKAVGKYLLSLEQKVHQILEWGCSKEGSGIRKAYRAAGDGKTELYVADIPLSMFKGILYALLKLQITGRFFHLDVLSLKYHSPIFDLVDGNLKGPGCYYTKRQMEPCLRFPRDDTTDIEDSQEV